MSEDLAVVGTWLAILPPILSIALAIATRAVHLSLFAGLWLGYALLAGDPISGLADAIDGVVQVLTDPGDARVVLFSALVGALIALTQRNGGVEGLIELLMRRSLVHTRPRALSLSFFLGVVIFVESSITSLVNGAVCRPIFDRLRISREKLAWLCDATAAPICILIPLNAWGAYIVSLLAKEGVADPLPTFIAAIPLNLYALFTLAFAFVVTVWKGWDFGPMRVAEARVATTGALWRAGSRPVLDADLGAIAAPEGAPRRARNFLIPILILATMMPVGLLVTGRGDMLAGSGSKAVLWAVIAAIVAAVGLGVSGRAMSLADAGATFWKGLGGLMPLAALMLLAFALGALAKKLGTGAYVAELVSDQVPALLVPAVLFVVGAAISFATGTSWGTFALVLPLAIPLAAATGTPLPLALAAVLSGGVFGDHCSPISDTTLIASLAAGTDLIDHVRTQLPYALVTGGASVVGFVVLAALA